MIRVRLKAVGIPRGTFLYSAMVKLDREFIHVSSVQENVSVSNHDDHLSACMILTLSAIIRLNRVDFKRQGIFLFVSS